MEKFSKIIVPAIIGLSAVGALYVCCTHTLSRRSRAAQIDMPSTPSLPEVRRARLIFAGDLMQHTPQLTAARTPEGDFDFNASFDWVRERFRAADAAIVNLETMPHPGFPTDMQPQMAAMLTCAEGTSIITEGVWDNRFRYTEQLVRMGARITVDGKVAVIEGVKGLRGAPVKACDLRGGAAVIIAGLMAKGTTEIEDTLHIERG